MSETQSAKRQRAHDDEGEDRGASGDDRGASGDDLDSLVQTLLTIDYTAFENHVKDIHWKKELLISSKLSELQKAINAKYKTFSDVPAEIIATNVFPFLEDRPDYNNLAQVNKSIHRAIAENKSISPPWPEMLVPDALVHHGMCTYPKFSLKGDYIIFLRNIAGLDPRIGEVDICLWSRRDGSLKTYKVSDLYVQALDDYDLDHGNCNLLLSPENDIILSTVQGYEIWRIGEDGEGVLQQTRIFEERAPGMDCYTFFSPNMQLYCFRANPLKVFRVSDGSCHCLIHPNLLRISTLAFSPDENSLAMCSFEGIVEMHALNRGDDGEDSCIARWDTEGGADFYAIKFSTDSKYLSTAHNGRIKIWHVETKTCISCMEASDPAADNITSVVEFWPFPNPAAVATSVSDADAMSASFLESKAALQMGASRAEMEFAMSKVGRV